MSSWGSYGSIYNLGHRYIADLLKGPVLVEEKVDGSQFSFGYIDGMLRARSKGAEMHIDAPEGMFKEGCEAVKAIANRLHPDWTYRGEYLKKPRHNGLAYDRVPKNHIIIFDINPAEQEFLSYSDKAAEAARLDLEVVPALWSGKLDHIEDFRCFLGNESVLGGQKIEGVVIKPLEYNYWGLDKKVLMGKFVSEAFKEVQSKAWKDDNPTGKDILSLLGDKYGTQARWNKAILHMAELGRIQNDVKDIGPCIKEIPGDILKECEGDIKDELMAWAWPHIRRLVTRGFPEYYKEQLLKKQFEEVS